MMTTDRERLERLERQNDRYQDTILRLTAERDNLRKWMERISQERVDWSLTDSGFSRLQDFAHHALNGERP
jgi:molecular chaperone GrpE (heat shock protein)